ncbi:MAG TPA: DUF4175 family protein, partial [Pedobacter sp.]
MDKQLPNQTLQIIRSHWSTARLIESCIISLAISLTISAFGIFIGGIAYYWVISLFFIVLLLLSFLNNFWRIDERKVVNFLDLNYPALEESAGLFIKDEEDLTGLEILQKQKIGAVLNQVKVPFFPDKKIYTGVGVLCLSILAYALAFIVPSESSPTFHNTANQASTKPGIVVNIPPTVANLEIFVTPPAYTRSLARSQEELYLKVESGAVVEWKVLMNKPVKVLKFIFNNNDQMILRAAATTPNEWRLKRKITEQGFYQMEIDGVKSDLYQIEIIPDLPVRIKVNSPRQHTIVDVGQPQRTTLKVSLIDDYGISSAYIAATMASGKGEGVSFTEKKLTFDHNFNNRLQADLVKVIDFKSLGMKPGDELYFYVSATDNYNQTSRSDVYFVSIVDTTELMSLAGMSNGVNLVPEYFRSQRQIIIDTEKLLKEQSTIPDQQFKIK